MAHRRERVLQSAILIVAATLAACGGSTPPVAAATADATSSDKPAAPAAGSAEADASKAPDSKESSGSDLNENQKGMMEGALRRGGDKAAQCAGVVPGAPRGEGTVKVLFDGHKGRISDVTVGAPFAGHAVEACIKRAFIGEFILPFDGGELEVDYTVKLPPEAGNDSKDAKGKGAKGKDVKGKDKKK